MKTSTMYGIGAFTGALAQGLNQGARNAADTMQTFGNLQAREQERKDRLAQQKIENEQKGKLFNLTEAELEDKRSERESAKAEKSRFQFYKMGMVSLDESLGPLGNANPDTFLQAYQQTPEGKTATGIAFDPQTATYTFTHADGHTETKTKRDMMAGFSAYAPENMRMLDKEKDDNLLGYERWAKAGDTISLMAATTPEEKRKKENAQAAWAAMGVKREYISPDSTAPEAPIDAILEPAKGPGILSRAFNYLPNKIGTGIGNMITPLNPRVPEQQAVQARAVDEGWPMSGLSQSGAAAAQQQGQPGASPMGFPTEAFMQGGALLAQQSDANQNGILEGPELNAAIAKAQRIAEAAKKGAPVDPKVVIEAQSFLAQFKKMTDAQNQQRLGIAR